jgi:RNA polymerase sigma-70 factor (ECF subfamily)
VAEEGSTSPGAAGDGAGEPLDTLARAAQGGDPQARDLFARRLQALVASSVRVQLGPQLLREVGFDDVVQELLLAIQGELPRLQVRGESQLHRWIQRIVHHRICDLHDYHERAAKRDPRRRVSLSDLLKGGEDGEEPAVLVSKAPTPVETASERELARRALVALERLSADEAAAVRRIALSGERIADVAREFGVGESTVRMRLARGLARLYRSLGGA